MYKFISNIIFSKLLEKSAKNYNDFFKKYFYILREFFNYYILSVLFSNDNFKFPFLNNNNIVIYVLM